MALKIVQYLEQVTPPNNGISTSSPISLQTGYLRFSSIGGSSYIRLDVNNSVGVTTSTGFAIPQNHVEILKERVARQKISGITTGASTVITFGENFGNPFIVGDYVTISGALPVGLNTVHQLITSRTDNSITISANTSSVSGILTVTNATVSRSIKISATALSDNVSLNISEVQIAGQ
jgi:hypothetical protein